jgi:hypothetical protein
MIYALGTQKRNARFLETGFVSRTDSNVVQYSGTNNGLPSNNRFVFQGNVLKVSRVTMDVQRLFTDFKLISKSNVRIV